MNNQLRLLSNYGGLAAHNLKDFVRHYYTVKDLIVLTPNLHSAGRMDLKDVLYELNGWRYTVACYFPTKEKKFSDIKEKFEDDFRGVTQNSARGIAFFTNQHVTPSERESLEKMAERSSSSARIYHVEAIRAILDSPRGYGMRLEFLRIPMKPEEQLSFISQFSSDLSAALNQNSDALSLIAKSVSEIHAAILGTPDLPLASRLSATIATRAMLTELAEASDRRAIKAKTTFVTRHLDTELLRVLHRSLFDSEPYYHQTGILRSVGVWIGAPGSTPENARYIPPGPEDIPSLVDNLLKTWRESYDNMLVAERAIKIEGIALFHHEFLRIHPFIDGNGRLARLLMEQQARELLNIDRRIVLEDSAAYFEALEKAHIGDFEELLKIVTQALLGTWKS